MSYTETRPFFLGLLWLFAKFSLYPTYALHESVYEPCLYDRNDSRFISTEFPQPQLMGRTTRAMHSVGLVTTNSCRSAQGRQDDISEGHRRDCITLTKLGNGGNELKKGIPWRERTRVNGYSGLTEMSDMHRSQACQGENLSREPRTNNECHELFYFIFIFQCFLLNN